MSEETIPGVDDKMNAEQTAKAKDTVEVSAAEFRAMQRQIRDMQKNFAVVVARNKELEVEATGGVLPESDQPIYELAAPWFSPDDVYYYEGMIVTDVRGDIIPNEFMIPRNEPAQQRYDAYMNGLPAPGRQPTISEMIDATARVMRDMGQGASGNEVQAAVFAALLSKGMDTKRGERNAAFTAPQRAVDRNNVPLMANTNITQQGTPQRPPVPKRGPVRTKQVGLAEESKANVQGSVQSPPLAQQPA
jgi:hypothetical protein